MEGDELMSAVGAKVTRTRCTSCEGLGRVALRSGIERCSWCDGLGFWYQSVTTQAEPEERGAYLRPGEEF